MNEQQLEEIKSLCSRHLELQEQKADLALRMKLVESSLASLRLSLGSDTYKIPLSFYMHINGALYCLDFDEEDASFSRLKQVSDVQIIA